MKGIIGFLMVLMARLVPKRFIKNRRAISTAAVVGAFIAAVIIIIAGVNMVPIIADEVDSVIFLNASGWNFTGASGAEAMLGLIPFVFICGLLLAAVGITLTWAKKSD